MDSVQEEIKRRIHWGCQTIHEEKVSIKESQKPNLIVSKPIKKSDWCSSIQSLNFGWFDISMS